MTNKLTPDQVMAVRRHMLKWHLERAALGWEPAIGELRESSPMWASQSSYKAPLREWWSTMSEDERRECLAEDSDPDPGFGYPFGTFKILLTKSQG